jgi:hypothetical protein
MAIGTCKQKNYVSCGGLSMQKFKPVSRKKVGSATQIQASKHGSKLSFKTFYSMGEQLGLNCKNKNCLVLHKCIIYVMSYTLLPTSSRGERGGMERRNGEGYFSV